MSNTERFKNILDEMYDTYRRKNSDYSNSFGDSVSEFGPVAGVVRISDKFNRLKSLLRENSVRLVNDESVMDTLTDMACYAIMLRMELEGGSSKDIEKRTSSYTISPNITAHKMTASELYTTLASLDHGDSTTLTITGVPDTTHFEIEISDTRIEALKYLIKHYNFL